MKKIKSFFRQLKSDLAPMSWKERLDHLWTYYKGALLWVIFGIAVITIGVNAIIQSQEQLLFAGATVNVELSEEGYAYMTDGLKTHLGGTKKNQTVTLTDTILDNPETAEDLEYLYNRSMWMAGMVIYENLDYALMDQIGMEFFIRQGVFGDLRNILSREQYALMEPYVIWSEATEETPSYPIAIDISHMPFAKACNEGKGKLYIAFPGNTERTGKTPAFLEHVLAWNP